MATRWTLGCDATDPQAIAAFWALALGYVLEPGFDDTDPQVTPLTPVWSKHPAAPGDRVEVV